LDCQASYERAKRLIKDHEKQLHLLAEALLEYETLSAEEITAVVEGKGLKHLKEKQRRV
jgi:ATP-dependent Zn protease